LLVATLRSWSLLLVVALPVAAEPAAPVQTSYTYTLSEDPDSEILSIGWVGIPYGTRRFILYGDGRLVGNTSRSSPPEQVKESIQRFLTRVEVREVVDIVVDAGLVDFEPGEMRERLGPRPMVTDTETLWLRVSLASYASPKRKEVNAFTHSTGIDSPKEEVVRYSEAKRLGRIAESEPETFVEAQSLLRLYERLDQLVYGNGGGGHP
jgi:hypothetical protein